MTVQTITSPSGERLVVLPDDERLAEADEDNIDRAAVKTVRGKLESGQEELLPSEVVDRILGGENPIKVWREYRGVTVSALAIAAGIGQSSLSQLELGERSVRRPGHPSAAMDGGVTVPPVGGAASIRPRLTRPRRPGDILGRMAGERNT